MHAVEVHGLRFELKRPHHPLQDTKSRAVVDAPGNHQRADEVSSTKERNKLTPNSAQRRSARRLAAFLQLKKEQEGREQKATDTDEPEIEEPARVESDARMDDATPADDVAERQEEQEEASESPAPAPTARSRADKKKARAESARIANGGRRGPGLSAPTPAEQRRGRAFEKREAKRRRKRAGSW